jgi:hypothetical protein
MGKWGNGEMGKWGNGEMGKLENGKTSNYYPIYFPSAIIHQTFTKRRVPERSGELMSI